MNPAALIDALRRLETAGWPVLVENGICNGGDAAFVGFEDEPHPMGLSALLSNRAISKRNEAILSGWLVGCLEARGYRRDVKVSKGNGKVRVCVWAEFSGFEVMTGWHDTELKALLEACLAVADA